MSKPVLNRLFTALFLIFTCAALHAQWNPVLTGASTNMHCVSLVGNQIFIGGNQLVKSPDGGANWSVNTLKHAQGFELLGSSLYDIHFFDAQNGVAVGLIEGGGQDIILRTTNGGLNWSYAYQGYGNGGALFTLHDLFFINSTVGWAVGRNGNIYKTVNAGASWVLQPSGTSSELYSVWFVNANLGFAAGSNVLLKTVNGGASWSPTSLNGAEKVVFADASTGYAGSGNTLFKTTNGGQSWSQLPLPAGSGYLTDLHLIGTQTCYALFNNTVLRSTNGGQSWEESAGLTSFSLVEQFEWLDSQQAVAAGGTLFCWITGNAGAPYKPIADYTVPQPLCSGTPQTITNKTADLPNYTYKWYLNGALVSTQRNPALVFPSPFTSYNLILEVSNGAATDIVEYFVQTAPTAVLATPNLSPSANPLCQGNPLVLYAELNNAAYWTLYANGQPTGVAGNLVQISYQASPQSTTTYHLHGELTGACNTAVADVQTTVTVTPLPVTVNIQADKPFVCPGEITRVLIPNSVPGVAYRLYAFSNFGNPDETQIGNGDTLFFQTPPVQENLYYQLEVSNQNCQRNLGQVVSVAPEYLLAVLSDSQITWAVGMPIQLNDTLTISGPNIVWDFGPFAQPTMATGENPVFEFTAPGFYTIYVKAIGQGDCMAQDSMQFEIFGQNNLPSGALTVCEDHLTPIHLTETWVREYILDAHQAADGTVYTVGYRKEYNAGYHYNIAIHKLAPDGSGLWSYFLSPDDQPTDVVQCIGTSIAADDAGNIYLAGTYYGSEISLGGQIIYDGWPMLEGFVAKLDPQGNLLWHIRMPGSGAPVGVTDLLYVNDHQIYLVAPETYVFKFPDGFNYQFDTDDLIGMIQIDADGHFVRARSIAKNTTDGQNLILSNYNPGQNNTTGPATTRISPLMRLDRQGRIVLAGEYRSPMLVAGQLLTPRIMQQRNGFIVHADQNLDILDAFTTYGVADISFNTADIYHQISTPPAFAIDDDGNIFQSFFINKGLNYPPPYHYAEVLDDVVEYGDDSHFLLKYSPSGELLWYRRNGPLQSPWLVADPGGSVHALASYYDVLGLNDADGTKRGLAGLGGFDAALLSWDEDGAITGVLPLSTPDNDMTAVLLSDGCGSLSGLLARDTSNVFFGGAEQFFQLLKFGEADNCAPDCPFEIVQQPQSLVFCRGENAFLAVGATGEALAYRWQREIIPGLYADLSDDTVYSGTQTSLLQIAAAQAPAVADHPFRCLVTNSLDSTIISESAMLLPLDTAVIAPLPPVTPVALNQFYTLAVSAGGNELQYEWQYLSAEGWQPLTGLAYYFNINDDSLRFKAYLPAFQNGQQLRCRVFNAEGCRVYTTATTLQFVSATGDPSADWPVTVGPSPFSDKLFLYAPAGGNEAVRWTVFDLEGREILCQAAPAQQRTTLPTRSWPAGIYLLRAECAGRVVWKRVVKGE